MDKGKLRALIIDEARLAFSICFSVSPLSSLTSRLGERPPVASLGAWGLLFSDKEPEAGASPEMSGD